MPTPRPRPGERAGGALAHLLLVVVLALGVVMMHSTGHPQGSPSGTSAVAGTVSTAANAMDAMSAADGSGGGSGAAAHAPDVGGSHGSGLPDEGHAPGSGMDMTTLCVAVLAGWLLAGLVRAALGRRPDWLVLLLARLTPALGPHAPPRRPPDLARLSVLRI
ncbi:hypothetical protein ACF1BN_27380 [Streptomyces sp. NPDC014861]|uniref:hypothetical protein n=1 Tax=Streptomyces sp. NPDC014861 TaxID=3364923 RepID=UPI0036F6EAF3